MTDLPDPGTDPIPEGGGPYRYPFLARLLGLDILAQQIVDALHVDLDQAALEDALATLRAADTTVDAIEPSTPATPARNHTGHRDGNPGASNKKGT